MDVQSASESAFIYNEMLDGGGKRFESIAQKTRQYLEAAEVRDAIPLENQAGAVVFISEKLLGEIRVRIGRKRDQKIETEFVDCLRRAEEILDRP